MIVAPLLDLVNFAVVPVLNPMIDAALGVRALAVERLAAIALGELGAQDGDAFDREHDISRALARLLFGV